MKIIFHRYGSIVEPDILAAFREFNIDVVEDTMEITQKSIDGETRLRVMAELILEHRPEFVFSINFFPYISMVCEKLDVKYVALSVDCPVLEIYDTSVRNKCNRLFLFDYHQYESVKDENPENIYYLPLGTNVARWDEVLGEIKSIDDLAGVKYQYDVSLVGSMYTEKSPLRNMKLDGFGNGYLEGLIKSQMLFPGLDLLEEVFRKPATSTSKLINGMKKSAPEFFEKYALEDGVVDTDNYIIVQNALGFEISARERVSLIKSLGNAGIDTHVFTRSDTAELLGDNDGQKMMGIKVHGGVTTHEEMPRVFRTSKINLNPTMRGIQTGLPQRIWDIMGCGGVCLTNYQAEIPEYFEIGEDILCYENERDAVEIARYYLEHEDERLCVAYNGYTKVKAMHDVKVRVARMLKSVIG